MRTIQVQEAFGLERLALVDRDAPTPGPGEVCLAVKGASLNYRDLLMVKGQYNPRQPLPFVPCSDGAGVVRAVGDGVTHMKVGDRVMNAFSPGWIAGDPDKTAIVHTFGGAIDGTLAEQMIVPASALVRSPAHLSDVEAATLPCAGLTAWRALFDLGGLVPGQTVLCLGTGGVSLYALQLAKAAGARVIITSSSDEKLERARQLGADEVLNYEAEPEWGKAVKKLTGGVDLVVEVGGSGTLGNSIKAVRPGGTIALIGVLAGGKPPDLTAVLMNQIRIQGVFVGPVRSLEALATAMTQHQMKPVLDKTFALADARAAFEHLERAAHFGKIGIAVDEQGS
jgi:NADPH:quinone reductase-like Zn-dependent oxidoreductase